MSTITHWQAVSERGKMSRINSIRFNLLIFILLYPFLGIAQRQYSCSKVPAFVKQKGFDTLRTAFSTAEKRYMGLVLIELAEKPAAGEQPDLNNQRARYYQHPSWKSAGYLASITMDKSGNAYAIPAPHISLLYNHPKQQNKIYRVDSKTGIMLPWMQLPVQQSKTLQNPYGLLGLTYDCADGSLFAATISGSTRTKEQGLLLHIRTSDKKVLDTLHGIDAMGLAVFQGIKGERRLYFGKIRTGEIFSVAIGTDGKFIRNSVQSECAITGIGPRGDDAPRKIRFDRDLMIVTGIAFNYNLQASSEKPETVYVYLRDPSAKTWQLINIQ